MPASAIMAMAAGKYRFIEFRRLFCLVFGHKYDWNNIHKSGPVKGWQLICLNCHKDTLEE